MGNLDLYERYAQPPGNALKPFTNGRFSGTDINPMWRIRALTEEFGPCGIGWYTDNEEYWREDSPDGTATVYCRLNLYIKKDGDWSKPIHGIGGNTLIAKTGGKADDDSFKKAYTDALGIACKALGIGANVWWEAPNQTKYTANIQNDATNPDSETETDETHSSLTDICVVCRNPIENYYYDNNKKFFSASKIIQKAKERFEVCMCYTCLQKAIRDDTPRTEYDARAMQEIA